MDAGASQTLCFSPQEATGGRKTRLFAKSVTPQCDWNHSLFRRPKV